MDGKHLVVVSLHMQAATFGLGDRGWTLVQGHPPAFNEARPEFGLEDPSVMVSVGCLYSNGAVPTRQCLQTGWIARVNVNLARWEAAHFPFRGAPPSLVGATAQWTGDRLIVWGGYELVLDPGGRTGCEGTYRPCDPSVPKKPVFRRESDMLHPLFSPAD